MNVLFDSLTRGAKRHGRAKIASARRRFLAVEQMEERTLLSAAPIPIGSLGDSLTDEYQFYAPDRTAAQNWVEILSALRPTQVTFGAFSTSTRGETRNQGYAQDWARSGATAVGSDVVGAGTTFINQYNGGDPANAPGLLTQPGGLSNIDVATILIGGNDYESTLTNTLSTIAGTTTLPQNTNIGQFIASELNTALGTIPTDIVNGVTGAMTAITAQNPSFPIVLVSPPDITVTPIVQEAVAALNSLKPGYGNLLEFALSGTASKIDTKLQALANQFAMTDPNVRFVNLDNVLTNFLQNPVVGGKNGTYIDPHVGGPSYTDLFVGDNFHPGTVAQAFIANAIIAQIDTIKGYENSITTLSDSEILAYAQKVQPVTKANLTSSPSSVIVGAPITFTVQIPSFPNINSTTTAVNFDTVPPTGSVAFFDLAQGNKLIGVTNLIPLGNGPKYTGSVATFTTSTLSLGLHQIVAIYNGDTVYPVASTATALVYVGKAMQAQVFSTLSLLQSQLGVQVGEAQLNRWSKELDRGARLKLVARSMVSYLYSHTTLPRRQAAALIEKARRSSKFI